MALATVARQVEIPLPMLHTGQRQVLQDVRRFNWLAAGRRWRKTTLCMRIAVEAASRRQAILWGAPTYDQVRVGWEEAKRAAGQWATFNESRMEARFPGGGRIFYRSLDNPNNARGHTADGCVIDEASFCPQLAWYEVIRPMLMDTGGWAWQIFTPNGRNFIWQEWTKTINGAEDSAAWRAPSLGVEIIDSRLVRCPHPLENPTLPFSEIKHLYETMPERSFRQEILAEFVEDGGGVFRNVRAVSVLQPGEYDPRHHYVAGLDWSAGGDDYTVLSVWDCVTSQQVHMERWSGLNNRVQVDRVIGLYRRWLWQDCLAESNSIGRPLIDWLRDEAAIPVRAWHTDNNSKRLVIERLAVGFEQQAFKLIADDNQIAEHEAFEQDRTPGGLVRFGAPDGFHDDTVIANALAWELARQTMRERDRLSEPFSDDRLVNDLPGMKKFFHTEEKKGKW